jgi:hypothetical protein
MTLSDTQPFIRELQAAIDTTRRERAAHNQLFAALHEQCLALSIRISRIEFEEELYSRVFTR